MTVQPHNARYAKLRRQVNGGNRNGFQCDFQLKILEPGRLALVVKKYAKPVDVSPVLVDKIRIPVWLESYGRTKIGTDYVFLCVQKWLRNVDHTASRLRWCSARFFNDNISLSQLPLRKGGIRNKPFGDCRKVIRLYRHNIGRSYAKGRLCEIMAFCTFAPISADRLRNCIM